MGNLLLFLAWTAVVAWYADFCGYERCERRWDERSRMAESARRHIEWQPFDQDAM